MFEGQFSKVNKYARNLEEGFEAKLQSSKKVKMPIYIKKKAKHGEESDADAERMVEYEANRENAYSLDDENDCLRSQVQALSFDWRRAAADLRDSKTELSFWKDKYRRLAENNAVMSEDLTRAHHKE